jgi:sugar lactone lactonase YvrE
VLCGLAPGRRSAPRLCTRGPLLRREDDGSLVTDADLNAASQPAAGNELVVDGRGNAWRDGSVRQVADGLAFPNGMLVTADNRTLIVAESYAKRLTAFEIAADGGLSNRRVWADLGDGVPDGICYDAAGAVWYSDVPNKRCVRVREGGEVLQTIKLDYGCFACALGGRDGRTLFMMATVWRGPENMFAEPRTGQVVATEAPAPRAGWP